MTDAIRCDQSDLIDGLRRFQDAFNRDFSYRDVLRDLDGVPKDKFQWIKEARSEEDLIDRLFFYYIYHRKNVWSFIKILPYSYKWLYEHIINSKDDKWISDYRRAINDIPNNRDWNVHRTTFLWNIQQNLKTLTRGKYLILFGKLGFGKRWLAADACRDYAIVSRMNFKIYWLNVSKCNTLELILEKLHRLKVLLQDQDLDIKYNEYTGSTKNGIYHLRTHLRKVLDRPDFKDCLIVLTDVQDENVVKAFELNCKMLLTTRHMEKLEKAIPRERRETIDIDRGFTLDESQELFLKAMQLKNVSEQTESMATFIHEIHDKCSGHPFIMSVIAKTFQNTRESREMRERRCQGWRENIENYKFEDDCKKIQMSVNESLQLLENEKQVGDYMKMVVFTDNVDVPIDVLAKLWGTSYQATEAAVEKFHKYSLVERHRVNETCSLHYVHNKFLKSEVSAEEQQQYHQQLLEKYEVEKKFRTRSGLELNFDDDHYFHFFIGYHILGARQFDLFDLYLDFGFIEEKIRVAKLPNILGDLKKFSSHIESREREHNRGLITELHLFLPTVERLLLQSSDITLLQYALTHEGVVKAAAQEQSLHFPDRVWFEDINNLKLENQIIEIQAASIPRIVRFAQPGESPLCLIYLQDNNIMLHEISTDYNFKPILFRNEMLSASVVEMQIFRNVAFLVLGDTGKLCYHNIKVAKSTARRPSIAAPLSPGGSEASVDKHPFVIENHHDKFTCFYVMDQSTTPHVDLIMGTVRGRLKFYRWTSAQKFEDNKHVIQTPLADLFRIVAIDNYAMLISANGSVGFVDLVNGSTMAQNIENEPQPDPLNLHQGKCRRNKDLPITILVTATKVIQFTHVRRIGRVIMLERAEIFSASEEFDDVKILSSAMSKDSEYIVLGTTSGIVVIDRYEKKICCRRSISDHVLSLDVRSDDDDKNLYFLLSVLNDADKVIHLNAFQSGAADSSTLQCVLEGEDLFDIRALDDDEWRLVCVDTKRNFHLLSSSDDFTTSLLKLPFRYQIKKLCFVNDGVVLCGCTNGHVYKFDLHRGEETDIAEMSSEITYMERFGQSVIISANNAYTVVELARNSTSVERSEIWGGKATRAYRYNDHLLLVVKKDCSVDLIDVSSKVLLHSLTNLIEEGNTCVAEAFCGSVLAIATIKNNVHLLEFSGNFRTQVTERSIEGQLSDGIGSVAISPEKYILAVGCYSGNIELFDLTQLIPLYTLESHKRPIMTLQFSPWREDEGHLILLSLSESINFWNVTHVLNNRVGLKRVETAPSRISARFKSPLKVVTPVETDLASSLRVMTLKERNWSSKTGAFDKRELLSCIKFVGKSAKKVVANDDFTRFVTIDNEGNIYHLRLIDQSASGGEQQVTIKVNGSASHSHE